MAKQFGIPIKYDNKLDLIRKVIDIHITLKPPKQRLVENARNALAYYLIYGYTKDSIKDLETAFDQELKGDYIRVLNSHLRSAGFLIKDRNNKQKSYLSPEMENYREEFVKREGKIFTIGFIKS